MGKKVLSTHYQQTCVVTNRLQGDMIRSIIGCLMTPWVWSAGGYSGPRQTPCQCLSPGVASEAAVTNYTNIPTQTLIIYWHVTSDRAIQAHSDCFNYSIMSRRQRFIDWWLPNLIGSQCRTPSGDPRRSERVLVLQHYNLQLSRLETLNSRWISD